MRILALSAAFASTSAAAFTDGELVAFREDAGGNRHAETILPLVEAARQAAGWSWAAIDRIAVNRGPGSFTAIRSALAAARGLCLATGVPGCGVTALEALAERAGETGGRSILCVLDARRGEAFVQAFGHDRVPLGPPVLQAHASLMDLVLDETVVLGDAHLIEDRVSRETSLVVSVPTAPWVAAAAVRRLARASDHADRGELAPLYLRAPDARPQPTPDAHAGVRVVAG